MMGSTRLLDYGGSGPPVPLRPPHWSNRAYILDLDEKRSLLRWLAARGLHPYLVDWGAPEQAERKLRP
jgi:polyhydroxyalkanoate synthase